MHKLYREKYCPRCRTLLFTGLNNRALADALKGIEQQCLRVQLLTTFGHGAPGILGFGNDPHTLSTIDGYYLDRMILRTTVPHSLQSVMAPNARVALFGCQIARGCEGEGLMRELAERLLVNGGLIEACKSDEYGHLGSRLVCFSRKNVQVEPGAKVMIWKGNEEYYCPRIRSEHS